MDKHDSSIDSRSARRLLSEDDLHTLYELLRGSPQANAIAEVKDAYRAGDFRRALSTFQAAKSQYEKRYGGLVHRNPRQVDGKQKPSERQMAKQKQRQDKVRTTLKTFNELLPGLERMANAQQAGGETDAAANETLTSRSATTRIEKKTGERVAPSQESNTGDPFPEELRTAFAAAESSAAQQEALTRYFDLHRVSSEQDLQENTYYYLRVRDKGHLLRTSRTHRITEVVPFRDAISEQPLKPISKQAVLQLASQGHVIRLAVKRPPTAGESVPTEGNVPPLSSGARQGDEDQSADERAGLGLNMGDFSQLAEAAQRSGLVPNADAIAHLRDREFRIGEYQKALQDLESMFAKFTASSARRQQRLRREELDIKSGKLQMSARDLLQKRQRDEAEAQRIQRARRRFQRVIEGLRMLAGG